MHTQIYLDNASTSYPKAPGVADAVHHYIENVGCNINRGGYQQAYNTAEVVMETREKLSQLFHYPHSRNVIFTSNVTHSINLLLKGLLRSGDHILVSAMEHNAVMRPLVQMQPLGIRFSRIPCNSAGEMRQEDAEALIQPETKAILVLHASNVCGTLLPLEPLGKLTKKHGLFFLVDAAQTAGVFAIDMGAMQIDALAFTGHKSLLGPQGIGGLVLSDQLAAACEPLISGGTGSLSDSEEVPPFLPDRFEAGTPNLPGIFGLHAALSYLEQTGLDAIRKREITLARQLHQQLAELPGIALPGTENWNCRAPIVSADFLQHDNAQIAHQLTENYGIQTRCGLHCSPNAHRTLGTFPQGTVRFSVSHFNTEQDIEACVQAVRALCQTI